jgi:DNA-binding XRE family transcriptional regulator
MQVGAYPPSPPKGLNMPKKPNKAQTAAAGNQLKQNEEYESSFQINAAKVGTLKDLRKATDHTQEDLAHALGVGQGTVSRIEKQSDMLVSTLQHYIESVGGSLQIMATFPNRPPLLIERLGKKGGHPQQDTNVKPPGSSSLPAS